MRLPRPRYSLRVLMLFVLVLAVAMGWMVNRSRLQRLAVAAVLEAKGSVFYDWNLAETSSGQRVPDTVPPGPQWLRSIIGDEPFQKIDGVIMVEQPPSDAVLAALESQGAIDHLWVNTSQLTDAGFQSLWKMTGIRHLTLIGGGAKGISIAPIANFSRLESLKFMYMTDLDDADMVYVERLVNLKDLDVSGTKIGDAGLAHLGSLDKLEVLAIADTKVTDAGLARLHGMRIEQIRIDWCPVTQEGVAALRKTLSKTAQIFGP